MSTTINVTTAQAWASSWRNNPPKPLSKGHLIDVDAINDLIAAGGVASIRAYMGVNGSGVQKLMFVGVDADGNDLIDSEEGYYIYPSDAACPSICDTTSPLY